MKFVNPKNDVAFKKIFGSEQKTHILISFLNAVLELEGDQAIQHLQLLNPYQTPKLESLKLTILDIRATNKKGITFIVEMQIEHVAGALKRFMYYATKAYSSQIDRGEEYPKLNQVIFVGILDFIMFEQDEDEKIPHEDDYLSHHRILNVKTHKHHLKDVAFTFIELPKFKQTENEVTTVLEKWLYFIKHAEGLQVIPPHAQEPAIQSAYEEANRFGWNKDDLEAYEYRGIKIQDDRGALQLAHEKGVEKGREEGEQIGLEKGREEGEQIGLEKGRDLEKVTLARRMQAKGYDLNDIAEVTELSLTDLENLDLDEVFP